MMRLAIFARTFRRPTLEQVLDAIAGSGIRDVQFNFSCAGMDTLPSKHESSLLDRITEAHRIRGLKMIAISGTFNAIHPNLELRNLLIQRCIKLIEACGYMKVPLVSLCTGTRCAEDMWTAHPDNTMPSVWMDLCRTLEPLIEAAEANDIDLGIESERSNVINTAQRARQLLDEMQSPKLRIIMDGANLIETCEQDSQQITLQKAFELLGEAIVSVHAKSASLEKPINQGSLDWQLYFALLHQLGYDGSVVLHNLFEKDVPASKEFIEKSTGIKG